MGGDTSCVCWWHGAVPELHCELYLLLYTRELCTLWRSNTDWHSGPCAGADHWPMLVTTGAPGGRTHCLGCSLHPSSTDHWLSTLGSLLWLKSENRESIRERSPNISWRYQCLGWTNSNCLWPELALVGSSICIESVRLEWTGVMLIYLATVISYHLSHLLHLANTITFSVFSDNKSSEFFGTEFLDLQQGQLYLEHWQL